MKHLDGDIQQIAGPMHLTQMRELVSKKAIRELMSIKAVIQNLIEKQILNYGEQIALPEERWVGLRVHLPW